MSDTIIHPAHESFSLSIPEEASWEAPSNLSDEVDALWQTEKKKRGSHLFNGTLVGILDVNVQGMVGRWFEYRYYVARKIIPNKLADLPISVGVSGIILHDDYIVFAKRSQHVMSYAGYWELAPSGAIDRQFYNSATGLIDLKSQICCELEEETGLSKKIITQVTPFAYTLDSNDPSYEVCLKLTPNLSLAEAQSHFQSRTNNEYDSFKVIPQEEIRSFIRDNINLILPTSKAILSFLNILD
ncbi:hypothetical protein [Poriferisphaera sp. WC338]|uniref:hypothetical protein n=1 Tax=Poriferisphaera sp. WC338 TaxID=3425129 RepID=UPI003D819FF1